MNIVYKLIFYYKKIYIINFLNENNYSNKYFNFIYFHVHFYEDYISLKFEVLQHQNDLNVSFSFPISLNLLCIGTVIS